MFVVDTNILLYAAECTFPYHRKARRALGSWMVGDRPCFVTWGILYEFMRVATHPAVFEHPWPWQQAFSFVESLLSGPSVGVLQQTQRHADVLREVVRQCPDVSGNVIHDGHTAVLMREHGVREIRTLDSHFRRFPFLTVVDPLA